MIPVVLGWVYVGTQTSAGSVKVALTEATVPALGSKRNVSGDCFGIRDRTSFDGLDTSHQYASAVDGYQDEESPSQDSTLRPQEFLPGGNVTSPAETPDGPFTSQSDAIEMSTMSKDRNVSTTTTLLPEQPRERLGGDKYFRCLLQTFMGFSIAGDELEPGPIFNYARLWTHANAVKYIADAFETYTARQLDERPVAKDREWDPDPENWKDNLQGSPEECSRYIDRDGKDDIDFSIHAPASAELNFNCIIAAFVAVFLQWGTTGAAIVIAFE